MTIANKPEESLARFSKVADRAVLRSRGWFTVLIFGN